MHAHEPSLFYLHPSGERSKVSLENYKGVRPRVRACSGPVQGLGSTHSHGFKMLRAFPALELLMAEQGGHELPSLHRDVTWLFILSSP